MAKDWQLVGGSSERIRDRGQKGRESDRQAETRDSQKNADAAHKIAAALIRKGEIEKREKLVQESPRHPPATATKPKSHQAVRQAKSEAKTAGQKLASSEFVQKTDHAADFHQLVHKRAEALSTVPAHPPQARPQVTGPKAPQPMPPPSAPHTPVPTRVATPPQHAKLPHKGTMPTSHADEANQQRDPLRSALAARTAQQEGARLPPKIDGSRESNLREGDGKGEKTKDKAGEAKRHEGSSTAHARGTRLADAGSSASIEADISRGGGQDAHGSPPESFPGLSVYNRDVPRAEVDAAHKAKVYRHYVEKSQWAMERLTAIGKLDDQLELGLKPLVDRVLTDDPDLQLATALFLKNVYGGTHA